MNKDALGTYRLAALTALLAVFFVGASGLLACSSNENILAPITNSGVSATPDQQAIAGSPIDKTNPATEVDSLPSPEYDTSKESSTELVNETEEIVAPEDLPVGTVLSKEQIELLGGSEALFYIEELSDSVFQKMNGATFTEGCPVSREDLRYVRLLHVNAEGDTLTGEMVCNALIAEDIVEIFSELYKASYPIERIRLADEYGGDDEASMQDNNTSCFNHRPIEGSGAVSRHSYGMAIDINPLYNPYNMAATSVVLPTTAGEYVDRDVNTPYTITSDDLCCQLFAQKGYVWGGDWIEPKDYQHFEKW